MTEVISELIGGTRPAFVRIYVPKIQLGLSSLAAKKEGLYYHRDPLRTWTTKIEPELVRIEKHNTAFANVDPDKVVDVIVFPELSVPAKIIPLISEWSKRCTTIVIGGSHYEHFEGKWRSVCPVVVDGVAYSTYKAVPSPYESPGITGAGLYPGPTIRKFKNTRIGNFVVLICSDYIDDEIRHKVVDAETDLVFVIACQLDVQKHYAQASLDCQHSPRGIYVIYSNLQLAQMGSGKSAVFGQVHRDFEGHFKRLNFSDLQPREKLWQSSSTYPVAIVSVDIAEKRPGLPKTTRTRTNVDVFMPSDFETPAAAPVKDASDRRAYKLIAFDLDGTLLRSTNFSYSWAVIWEKAWGDADGVKWKGLMGKYLQGKLTYQAWCETAVAEFRAKNITVGDIATLAKEFVLVQNCKEVLLRLRTEGYKLVLLSGGIDVFLKMHLREAKELFDIIYINELAFDMDGVIHSVKATAHDYDGKRQAINQLCESEGIALEDVLYVGDSINDESLLNVVGCFVSMAARKDERVSMTANFHVVQPDLEEIYNIVLKGKEQPAF